MNGAADAVDRFSDVPLVGGAIGSIADEITAIGNETTDLGNQGKQAIWRGRSHRRDPHDAAATVPFILLWLPIRIGWERERASVRDALADGVPGIREYLAHRTVEVMSFRDLRKITPDPYTDLREGRFQALASVELKRLGLFPTHRPERRDGTGIATRE